MAKKQRNPSLVLTAWSCFPNEIAQEQFKSTTVVATVCDQLNPWHFRLCTPAMRRKCMQDKRCQTCAPHARFDYEALAKRLGVKNPSPKRYSKGTIHWLTTQAERVVDKYLRQCVKECRRLTVEIKE